MLPCAECERVGGVCMCVCGGEKPWASRPLSQGQLRWHLPSQLGRKHVMVLNPIEGRYLTGPRPIADGTETYNELNRPETTNAAKQMLGHSGRRYMIYDIWCTAICVTAYTMIDGLVGKRGGGRLKSEDDAQPTECIAQSETREGSRIIVCKKSRNLENTQIY